MPAKVSLPLLNGQKMPIVGLGTWQSGKGEVGEAVSIAIDAGYRHIDTAQVYNNEGEIGAAVEQKIQEGKIKREELFITTKLNCAGMAPDHVRSETELSLKRLRTDYIDLYLIHFPVALSDEGLHDEPPRYFPAYKTGGMKAAFISLLDTWREMEKLVDDGLVKAIGISNFNKEQVQQIFEQARIKPCNLQVECHAWFPQYELVDFCQQRGITVSAYGPIGSPGRPSGASQGDIPLMEEPIVKELAQKHNKTSAQILCRYLMQRNIIVLPKSVNPGRIVSNFQVFDFDLSEEDMEDLKRVNRESRLFTFQFLGKATSHPSFPWPLTQ